MNYLHLADCHLSGINKFNKSFSRLIREKNRQSFAQILEKNKDLDFILIAGDLYERNIFTFSDYKKMFSIMEDFGKDIYYVTGNHDYISDDNQIFFNYKPKNLHIFPSDRVSFFEKENYRIYGISYADRIFQNENFDYNIGLDHSYNNILLLHADVFSKNTTYLNLDLEKIKSLGFDYVALGHIHKREKFYDNIYYAGSIEPGSFKDIYTYGYNLIKEGQVEEIDSSLLKFYEMDLKDKYFVKEDQVIDYINTRLKNKENFLRLIVNEDFSFDLDRIKEKTRVSFIEKIVKEDTSYQDLEDIFPDSLLSKYKAYFESLDMTDPLNEKTLQVGLDAILRSKYD
jgi:exonuclease SbcD